MTENKRRKILLRPRMGWSVMTENKRRKIEGMKALGFERHGPRYTWRGNDRDPHERCSCRCGYTLPFYRIGLAEKHRARCSEKS
jgi:hypothetical protein